MITIYWHCLETTATDEDEKFVAGALDQLAQHLRKEPTKLPISIKRLGDEPELARKVAEKLNRLNDQLYTFSDCAADIADVLPIDKAYTAKLLVYCSPHGHIAVAAQRKNPDARWGGTCGPLAAVYKPNDKNGVFHEALHLLGADECYREDDPYQKKPDCNRDGCIMEYEPTENTCEDWPFLCDKNVRIIRDLAKQVENRMLLF